MTALGMTASSSGPCDHVSGPGSPSKLTSCTTKLGLADHSSGTHGKAPIWLAVWRPQGDAGFIAEATEQAGSRCQVPPFFTETHIRYPPTSAPVVGALSGHLHPERLGEVLMVTPLVSRAGG